jgi:hypothetical protein
MRSGSNPVLVEEPLQSKMASFTGGNEDSSECETDLSPDPLAFGVKQKLPAFAPTSKPIDISVSVKTRDR